MLRSKMSKAPIMCLLSDEGKFLASADVSDVIWKREKEGTFHNLNTISFTVMARGRIGQLLVTNHERAIAKPFDPGVSAPVFKGVVVAYHPGHLTIDADAAEEDMRAIGINIEDEPTGIETILKAIRRVGAGNLR
jgi:hypothetical protein